MCSLKINLLPATQAKRIRVGQLPNSVDVVKVFHTESIHQLSLYLKESDSQTKTTLNKAFAYWVHCNINQKGIDNQRFLDLMMEMDKSHPGLTASLLTQARCIAKQIKRHLAYLGQYLVSESNSLSLLFTCTKRGVFLFCVSDDFLT